MTVKNGIENNERIVNDWFSITKMGKISKKRKIIYKDCKDLYVQIDKKIMKYPPKSGVVLFDSFFKKVLLVKNNYGNIKTSKWGLPKGHLEKNETYVDGGHREFNEETGLFIDKSQYNKKCVKINNSKYYVYYTDNVQLSLNPLDNKEIKDVQFKNISELNEDNINKETYILLKKKMLKCIKSSIEIIFK